MIIRVELTEDEYNEIDFGNEHELSNHIIQALDNSSPEMPGFDVVIEIT